jgi:cbb3-type cytochrome oxidase maturation protein
MTFLNVLIPVSLSMGLIGLFAFFWAMRTNQFEDLKGNAWRVITPDQPQGNDHPPEKEGKSDDNLAAHAEDRDTRRGL